MTQDELQTLIIAQAPALRQALTFRERLAAIVDTVKDVDCVAETSSVTPSSLFDNCNIVK